MLKYRGDFSLGIVGFPNENRLRKKEAMTIPIFQVILHDVSILS